MRQDTAIFCVARDQSVLNGGHQAGVSDLNLGGIVIQNNHYDLRVLIKSSYFFQDLLAIQCI